LSAQKTLRKKRAVHPEQIDIEQTDFFEKLEKDVEATNWNYKSNNAENLQQRDHALVSSLILTGLRITELLERKKGDFKDHKNNISLFSVPTLKHGKVRTEIRMSKTGALAPLTMKLKQWLDLIPEEDAYAFPSGRGDGFIWAHPVGRKRAWQIIYTTTGKFPHLYRGIHETIYGKLVFNKDPWKLKEYMGLNRLDSTTPYVGTPWQQDLDKLAKLRGEQHEQP
jgi:integrase